MPGIRTNRLAFSTSVVVVNWNGADLLPECLDALRNQAETGFEVIVVDNGSRDGSQALIRRDYPEVNLVELRQNQGFARANNLGIQAARGRRIALINNDAVADRAWLAELNRALDRNPEIGFCASKMVRYDNPDIIDAAGDMPGLARGFKRGQGERDGPEFQKEIEVFAACAGAAIYRRDMLDTIGLFDESFFANLEDMDLSFRAQLAGYRCLYVPGAVVRHRVGTTKKKLNWSGRLTERNNWLFWLKNAPAAVFLRTFPRLLRFEIITMLKRFSWIFRFPGKGHLMPFLIAVGARCELILYLPRILVQRRRIQSRRRVSSGYILSWIRYPAGADKP